MYFLKWKANWCVKVVDTGTSRLSNHDWSHSSVHCFVFFFLSFFLKPNIHREKIFEKAELQFSALLRTASLGNHILVFTDGFCDAEEIMARENWHHFSGVRRAPWLIRNCCNQLIYGDGSFLTNQTEMSLNKNPIDSLKTALYVSCRISPWSSPPTWK